MPDSRVDAAAEANRYLRGLADRVAAACVAHVQPRAILLTGSVAEGEGDDHSDIDLITYYDELPDDERLAAVRHQIGAEGFESLGGSRHEGGFGEQYAIDGVECQVLYTTVGAWERLMAGVLERLDTGAIAQKSIDGLLRGVPLHGAELVERWQSRARAYPDGLARAMVEAHLRFFPIWYVGDWFAARDATLWFYQTLVESSQNVLGVLAGVNRLYYSPFQFKRARRFIERLRVAPDNLADRLDGLFTAEYSGAVSELERLVAETVVIVEAQLPEIDTARIRRHLGARRRPWTLAPEGTR